jgi:hypothetical protein
MIDIIVIIGVLLGIATSFLFKGIFHKIIVFGTSVPLLAMSIFGLANSIDGWTIAAETSFLTSVLMAILTIIYAIREIKTNRLKRLGVITFGTVFIIAFLFMLLNLPFYAFVKLVLTLSFIPYIITVIIDKQHFTKEISFMIIWFALVLSMYIS